MTANIHRVLVVGVGSIGERHLRCMQRTNRTTTGICEINDKLRQDVGQRYSVADAFAKLEEAMSHQWDAAVIATPAPFHIPMAMTLAKAGVHLLIEKPLSTSLEGVSDLIREVDKRKLVVSVGYTLRAYTIVAAVREAVRSGRFGKPVELTLVSGQHFPTYRPAYRQIYYADRAKGGGAIQDAITHWFNAAEWIVGPIDHVVADAAHQVLEGVTVEDTVHVLTRHGTVMGSFCLNQHQAPNETTLTVVCEKGTVRCELHNLRWRWMTEPSGQWHDETLPSMERDDFFTMQEDAFLDAVEGKAPPLCTLQEAAQTLRVNLAVLNSALSGKSMQPVG